MAENAMNNISGIELGALVIDGTTPTNCIMIQTRRNRYCFRLSETFPVGKQYDMFRQFVIDVNTPVQTEQPVEAPAEAPVEQPTETPVVEEAPVVEVATQD